MTPPKPDRPAAVIGIRVESGSDSRAGRFIIGAIAAGILACVVVVSTAQKVRVVEQARMVPSRHRRFQMR